MIKNINHYFLSLAIINFVIGFPKIITILIITIIKTAKIIIYIVPTLKKMKVENNVSKKDQNDINNNDNKVYNNNNSKGFDGTQNRNNNHWNTTTTKGKTNYFNPSSNLIRVYTQHNNNDNTTNNNKKRNDFNSQNREIFERIKTSEDIFKIVTVTHSEILK